MRQLPPPTARAILQVVAFENETTVAALLADASGISAKRRRRAAILALRAHRDERDRPVWTTAEIASWFGVARSLVSEAYRAENGEYEGTADARVTQDDEAGA